MQHFEAIWVPIVTPFLDGELDHSALRRHARHLADSGIAGLVCGATTGEGHALRMDERQAMVGTLRAELGQAYPLILGVSGSDTATCAASARQLAALSPHALLVTPPPYVRPGQAGLLAHFDSVAQAAGQALMVYNIPYRSAVDVELATLQNLAARGAICAIKECGGSIERLMQLVHQTPLAVLCGDDTRILPALACGAHGAVCASANLCPQAFVALYEHLKSGRLPAAQGLAAKLQAVIETLFSQANPIMLKAALAQAGWLRNELRLPLVATSEHDDPVLAQLKTQLAALASVGQ